MVVTKRDQVLAAARTFANERFPRESLTLSEFGTPSIGPDDSETYFVMVEAVTGQMLLRVTLDPQGSARAEPLTAY